MTAPQAVVLPAKTVRLVHAAMVAGVLLFAVVAHFVLRPQMASAGEVSPVILRTVLGVTLGACALSLLLRRRVPRRASDESADLFWTTAAAPAMLTWAPLEVANLLAIFLYARTGILPTIGVAAVTLLLFVALNPAYLERR